MIRMINVREALWLSHEDILGKGALQEGIVDIELTKAPPVTSGERENQTNSGWFHYWAEGVMIVNVRPPMKPPGNHSYFVPVHITIRLAFDSKDPLTTHNVLSRLGWYRFPSAIPNKGIKLFRHCSAPFRVFNDLCYSDQFYVSGKLGREGEFMDWFVNVMARTSDWRGGGGSGAWQRGLGFLSSGT